MKKKINNNIIYVVIVFIVVLMIVLRPQTSEFIETEKEEIETTGSGFLEVETFPSDADIFVDGIYSGKSPDTLYNIAAGTHNVVIKKDGYDDFVKEISVEAGRKTFLEAKLELLQVVEEVETEIIDESPQTLEVIEETSAEDLESSLVNIGEKFTLYYDFSEGEFLDNRQLSSDVFSKRYQKHLIFTRFNPVNIKVINKNINEVEREDCIGTIGQLAWLYSKQSLCVITIEGNVAAVGGTWEETKNAELIWKLLS